MNICCYSPASDQNTSSIDSGNVLVLHVRVGVIDWSKDENAVADVLCDVQWSDCAGPRKSSGNRLTTVCIFRMTHLAGRSGEELFSTKTSPTSFKVILYVHRPSDKATISVVPSCRGGLRVRVMPGTTSSWLAPTQMTPSPPPGLTCH